jgi:hypothetical protein
VCPLGLSLTALAVHLITQIPAVKLAVTLTATMDTGAIITLKLIWLASGPTYRERERERERETERERQRERQRQRDRERERQRQRERERERQRERQRDRDREREVR